MSRLINLSRRSAPTLILLCAAAASCYGQLAQVTGRVTDQSDAIIPGVEIAITNNDTGVVSRSRTNEAGYYVVLQLIPGNYSVSARKEGFRPVSRSGVRLEVQQSARIDFMLEVGAVTESIEVVQRAPLLETSTATVGQVMEYQRIIDLPGMRNPLSVANLVPGVNPTGSGPTPQMGGGRNSENDVLVDGASYIVSENAPGVNRLVYPPSADFVEEVKVEINTLSAQYGRFSGGVISAVTKSGTNEFHGTAYNYLRNSKLDANNFFANKAGRPRGNTKQNQAGFAAGGPIRKNQTFYFAGLEGTFARTQGVLQSTVPVAPWRTGDFADLRLNNGQPVTLFDPLTGRADPANPNLFLRSPFPSNRIPDNRIDPVSRKVMSYYPQPNATATNQFTGANNFVGVGSTKNDGYNLNVRIDHNISDAWRLYGRFTGLWRDVLAPNYWNNEAFAGSGPNNQRPISITLNQSYTLTPTLIATFNYGFSRFNDFRHNIRDDFDQTTLGFPPEVKLQAVRETEASFPVFIMGGTTADMGSGASGTVWLCSMTHTASPSLVKVTGKHTIRFGGEYRKMLMNFWQNNGGTGYYTFGREWTQRELNVSRTNEGFPLASFLLGLGSSGFMQHRIRPASASSYWAGYVQDDWKATPKLTLNLGLRYELDVPRSERYNRMSYWLMDAPSPIAGRVRSDGCPSCRSLRGAMMFTDENRRTQTPADKNNFAPRIGIAYQLTPATVVRAGYGVSYSPSPMTAGGNSNNGRQGFNSQTDVPYTLDGRRTINTTLSNPFPDGFNLPGGKSLGPGTDIGFGINDSLFDAWVNPVVHQWNLNFQRSLPGQLVVEAGYLGSRGIRLLDGDGNFPYNQLPASMMALGAQLIQQVPNPFLGVITNATSTLSRQTIAYNQLQRSFPHYTDVSSTMKPHSNSAYHAFTLRVEKRFQRGLSFLAAFTGAKLMDDASAAVGFYGPVVGQHLDQYNRRLEWSLSSMDVSRRLVLSYVYELPFGTGKAIGGQAPRPLSWLISGWQANGILTFANGNPLFIAGVPNNTAIFSGQRANNDGTSAYLDHSGDTTDEFLARWFRTEAFSIPAPYTFGNVARTLPDARHPGTASTSFSFFKALPVVAERLKIQYRLELFNALNNPQWGRADTGIQSPTFGQINSAGGARQIQMALRLLW